ncbi:MAG TPA: heme ABC transporter permease, partial [Nitrospira sp.]|nr:heme ABC transporter permease [Nitrospira sp.]
MKLPLATGSPRSCADRLSHKQGSAPPAHGNVVQGAILTRSRLILILGLLSLTAVIVSLVCLHFGAQPIAYGEMLRVLMGAITVDQAEADGGSADITRTILLQIRLPRVLLGFLVGCSLASVGVVLQALLRNPLADPYVLGVSSGAALGAAVG